MSVYSYKRKLIRKFDKLQNISKKVHVRTVAGGKEWILQNRTIKTKIFGTDFFPQ